LDIGKEAFRKEKNAKGGGAARGNQRELKN